MHLAPELLVCLFIEQSILNIDGDDPRDDLHKGYIFIGEVALFC